MQKKSKWFSLFYAKCKFLFLSFDSGMKYDSLVFLTLFVRFAHHFLHHM